MKPVITIGEVTVELDCVVAVEEPFETWDPVSYKYIDGWVVCWWASRGVGMMKMPPARFSCDPDEASQAVAKEAAWAEFNRIIAMKGWNR
jgi:hypothetical protein